jgi:hypothetical protein
MSPWVKRCATTLRRWRRPQATIYGQTQIDMSGVEQITESARTRAIARAINHARRYLNGNKSVVEAIGRVMVDVRAGGLDVLDPRLTGDLAEFRGLDLAAALNRIRGVNVKQTNK